MSEKRYQSSDYRKKKTVADDEVKLSGFNGLKGNSNLTEEQAIEAVEQSQNEDFEGNEQTVNQLRYEKKKSLQLEFPDKENGESAMEIAFSKAR